MQDVIFRRVRGILNKITPETFDKLTNELINVGLDSPKTLRGLIYLLFDKALKDLKYSSLYAKLCQELSERAPNFETEPGPNTFCKFLISKCEDEFERRRKANEDFEGRTELTDEEFEQKAIAKQKMLGNIKFICELGKKRLLQEEILHECIRGLLSKKKERTIKDQAQDLECLCQIMRTIGSLLDIKASRNLMNQYFERIEIYSRRQDLPPRIKFMLRDVIDLRNNNWRPRPYQREDHVPQPLSKLRAESGYDPNIVGSSLEKIGNNSRDFLNLGELSKVRGGKLSSLLLDDDGPSFTTSTDMHWGPTTFLPFDNEFDAFSSPPFPTKISTAQPSTTASRTYPLAPIQPTSTTTPNNPGTRSNAINPRARNGTQSSSSSSSLSRPPPNLTRPQFGGPRNERQTFATDARLPPGNARPERYRLDSSRTQHKDFLMDSSHINQPHLQHHHQQPQNQQLPHQQHNSQPQPDFYKPPNHETPAFGRRDEPKGPRIIGPPPQSSQPLPPRNVPPGVQSQQRRIRHEPFAPDTAPPVVAGLPPNERIRPARNRSARSAERPRGPELQHNPRSFNDVPGYIAAPINEGTREPSRFAPKQPPHLNQGRAAQFDDYGSSRPPHSTHQIVVTSPTGPLPPPHIHHSDRNLNQTRPNNQSNRSHSPPPAVRSVGMRAERTPVQAPEVKPIVSQLHQTAPPPPHPNVRESIYPPGRHSNAELNMNWRASKSEKAAAALPNNSYSSDSSQASPRTGHSKNNNGSQPFDASDKLEIHAGRRSNMASCNQPKQTPTVGHARIQEQPPRLQALASKTARLEVQQKQQQPLFKPNQTVREPSDQSPIVPSDFRFAQQKIPAQQPSWPQMIHEARLSEGDTNIQMLPRFAENAQSNNNLNGMPALKKSPSQNSNQDPPKRDAPNEPNSKTNSSQPDKGKQERTKGGNRPFTGNRFTDETYVSESDKILDWRKNFGSKNSPPVSNTNINTSKRNVQSGNSTKNHAQAPTARPVITNPILQKPLPKVIDANLSLRPSHNLVGRTLAIPVRNDPTPSTDTKPNGKPVMPSQDVRVQTRPSNPEQTANPTSNSAAAPSTVPSPSKREEKDTAPRVSALDTLLKALMSLLAELSNPAFSNLNKIDIKTKELKVPKSLQPDCLVSVLKQTITKSETDRENLGKFLAKIVPSVFDAASLASAYKKLFDELPALEVETPRVKSLIAGLLSRSIADCLLPLEEVGAILAGGKHHPLFLLCLQKLEACKGQAWLVEKFNLSKIELMDMLPEVDRTKERLASILKDRCLGFLDPMLTIEPDLWEQMKERDPSPTAVYRWIKDNVDQTLQGTPTFAHVLMNCLLKYIHNMVEGKQSKLLSTGEGQQHVPSCDVDAVSTSDSSKSTPSSASNQACADLEKEMLTKYWQVLQAILKDDKHMQLATLYAIQSFYYGLDFPKGAILRWFHTLYDMNIVDEEVFFKWKEEINDEYPGKGQALFQVNVWLNWLAEEDSDDEAEDCDDEEDEAEDETPTGPQAKLKELGVGVPINVKTGNM